MANRLVKRGRAVYIPGVPSKPAVPPHYVVPEPPAPTTPDPTGLDWVYWRPILDQWQKSAPWSFPYTVRRRWPDPTVYGPILIRYDYLPWFRLYPDAFQEIREELRPIYAHLGGAYAYI